MNEDELRDALRAIAGRTAPTTAPPILLAAQRLRRRRIAAAAMTAAAATVAVLGAMALLGDDESRVRTIPADPTSTTSTTTVASPPATTVAITDKGAVVVIDTASGRTRTLVAAGAGGGGVALSPDGGTVYYGEEQAGCATGHIRSVSIHGPPEPLERVAEGMHPAVSPDGSRLAFWSRRSSGPGTCEHTLVVRHLATGLEQRWTARPNGYFELGFVDPLDWAPDGRRLVFGFQYEGLGAWILDTAVPGPLNLARGLDLGAGLPSWHPDGRIAVVLDCCLDPDAPRVPPRTVLHDPGTKRSTTLFEADVQPQSIDFDPTGRFVLYVDDTGRLGVRDEAGKATSLGSGYTDATW